MGATEGASIGAAAAAAVAGGVYFAKNGDFPSGSKKSESAQGIAERIASISDEEIASVFGEKVEEIEAVVKEVASDGYNFVAHHKTLAVLVAVLVVLILGGVLAVRRNKTKSIESVVEDKADTAEFAVEKDVGKVGPAAVTNQDVTTNDGEEEEFSTPPKKIVDTASADEARTELHLDDQEELVAAVTPADTAVAGEQGPPKIKFRSPMKKGKVRSPMRRGGKN
mmetsp:Transcript_16468/g.47294  ORF Transcript_16468/g.47294 Transcript_16468/m.47294 type:complete len:224 (-) Transcript_16468:1241-1912(-)